MTELTKAEREALVDRARAIRDYKLMQAKGYERLARRAKDETTRRLLAELSAGETRECEYWSREIEGLGGGVERAGKMFLIGQRVDLMLRILGPRAFMEWAVIAEDDSLEELAIAAMNIGDAATSDAWSRIASDESLHVERIKKEVLGMEAWEMTGGGGVRDVIFGANDGLVSILALVAGVYGAITDSHTIFVAGVAGAVAGAISMGAGAYLSSKSEKEVTERESERKGIRRKGTPEEERARLAKFYRARGFSKREAEALASRVRAEMESASEYAVAEDTGLASEESWPPMKACVLTGLSFAIVSLIPILPFAFMRVTPAVITAVVASVGSLFAVGASKAIFTRKSWIRSGLEMMAIGTLAAAATYGIGLLIPV